MSPHSNNDILAKPDRAGPRPMSIALLVAAAFFMENLDGTVITTAMPDMAKSFGVRPVDLNVGISAYLLTLGVFIPISGWVAERFGARTVFAAAIVMFTLASLLCGLADGIGAFVALRVLQGIGGALMVPVGRLVVLWVTPKPQLMNVMSTITWPALVAPVLGPPVGGFITTYATWRWIFYLNLPLGILALIVTMFLIPNNPATKARPFDFRGFVLSGGGMLSLMYGLDLVAREEIDWVAVAGFILVALAVLALAVRHMIVAASPMIDLSTLRVPTFAVAIFGGTLSRLSIGAVPFLLPLMFQVGFGLDAFHSGLLVIAVFAGNLLMKTVTTPILRRFGFRPVLIVNGLANAAAIAACAWLTPETPVAVIVAILFAGGLFRSMQFTALSTLAFADVPPPKMSGANTMISTVFQLSMGMGVAVGAIGLRVAHGVSAGLGIDRVPAVDYRIAFGLVAILALGSLFDIVRLKPGAGDHLAAGRV